ncbi:hypothetical protein B0J11DRAFT_512098 [Dendryphion nanum]|uniref:Uncharacterized protein n=1 Tax=Dendryphion nanum TaxID=256645 RepID=A0A9P9I9E3_9PLEO|nr:hypothetical protein B0J11DRAFT_585720 [Dendryphion nanum]KAH7111856.1 hypothetical protein B0J11DRAFT_512098 [Dendryphion nanum]
MAGQRSFYASSAQAQPDPNGGLSGALDGSQVRPVAIDNQLFVIDGMLYEALRTIGKTRKDLHNARVAFATQEHAYHEEQKNWALRAEAGSALQAHCQQLQEILRKKDIELEEYRQLVKAYASDGRFESSRDTMEPAWSNDELNAQVADHMVGTSDTTHDPWKFHAVQERHKALVDVLTEANAADRRTSGIESICHTVESEEPATALLESPEVDRYQCEESTAKNRGASKKGRRRRRN